MGQREMITAGSAGSLGLMSYVRVPSSLLRLEPVAFRLSVRASTRHYHSGIVFLQHDGSLLVGLSVRPKIKRRPNLRLKC